MEYVYEKELFNRILYEFNAIKNQKLPSYLNYMLSSCKREVKLKKLLSKSQVQVEKELEVMADGEAEEEKKTEEIKDGEEEEKKTVEDKADAMARKLQ